MKKLLLIFALFLSSMTAWAETKIGVVNTDRILRESAPALRAGKKLEREFDARRSEVQKISQQGKALQQQLDRGGLSEEDRKVKERELIRLTQDFNRMQRELNEDLNARQNEELAGLRERVNSAIQQIANAEKYDLILQEAAYSNPRIDITDKVLKLLTDKQ
ncbi:periplasmic chaperone for outer membrane proteins Skp [Andreprevotia lacus DSM 23236]|uniref:Periplasmic chaperone for outer membrane proteins Skp n=1 Tax=Andreprevotia lacus DSM 23236 TaxID=1121001 RepID=A0A1W1XLD1_9NEIS|nr:OmpH family outer membrane protein [Andreprevotia lacus]SMC24763.1 periplasmic chaperone for outer membrane proteins Skp [Andreprevotia lacus DSM 23236]